MLNTYFVNAKCVCVRAFPSVEERNWLPKVELTRIVEQRKLLGEDGLKEKAEVLKVSKALNDVKPPNSLLTEFLVPSCDNINYHHLKVYKSNDVLNVDNVFDFSEIPVYTEVFDAHTNFIYVSFIIYINELVIIQFFSDNGFNEH